jgi:hypothetical protein
MRTIGHLACRNASDASFFGSLPQAPREFQQLHRMLAKLPRAELICHG